jgi:hypothetical protein
MYINFKWKLSKQVFHNLHNSFVPYINLLLPESISIGHTSLPTHILHWELISSRLTKSARDKFVLRYASDNKQCNTIHFRRKKWILKHILFYLQTPGFSSIATRLPIGRPGNLSWIPGRPSNYLFFTAPTPALGPIQPLPNSTGVPSREIKRSQRQTDNSTTLYIEDTNDQSHTPFPHTFKLHGVSKHSYNFTVSSHL